MGESFQKLNLTNAYLFAAAMQDEEICRNVLEIALDRKISKVKAHTEHTVFLDTEFKGRYRYVFEEYCKDADIALGDETQNRRSCK